MFTVQTGAVANGSITWTFGHATDGSGTDGAAIVPTEGALTVVTTSNDPLTQKCTIPASSVNGWVRVVGTIVTGAVLVGVSMLAHPKYVG